MEYTIVYSSTSEDSGVKDLIAKVNRHINDGWKPAGGIAVSTAGNFFPERFYQAMTKGDA